MTSCFIEISNTMWINISLINKLVRNKNNKYILLLKSGEKYVLTTEKALSLIKMGICKCQERAKDK